MNRRLHVTSLGGWISASVSSVAGGEAAGAPTLTALSIDVLAVLRWAVRLSAAAQLPLTLTFADYNRVEKIATLPRPLTTRGVPVGAGPKAPSKSFLSLSE